VFRNVKLISLISCWNRLTHLRAHGI